MTPAANSAIAVEQDRNLTGPPRLQRLDLLSDDPKELATLDGYEGGLSVSPSGKKVAYFIDKEILEVRDLASPNLLARLRVGLGVFRWSPDESRILLKRAIEKKSGDLVWIDLPPLAASAGHDIPVSEPQPIPLLHGISFRNFARVVTFCLHAVSPTQNLRLVRCSCNSGWRPSKYVAIALMNS